MEEKNSDIELLNYIYQNASMGSESISYILDQDIDEDIIDELKREKEEYDQMAEDSEKMLHSFGTEEKDKSVISKVETYFAVKMSTMKDDKSSHIAEMMIQGNNMGIVDITKHLNKYKDTDKKVHKLATNLLEMEENNVQKLKDYL